ncbi:MAG: dTDP-glucose 4,6-dehydratase [Acidobacteriota bacterium]
MGRQSVFQLLLVCLYAGIDDGRGVELPISRLRHLSRPASRRRPGGTPRRSRAPAATRSAVATLAAGDATVLEDVADHPRFEFVRGDITDRELVRKLFEEHDFLGVMHLAAESHVDRSIVDPMAFVQTNVNGTVVLLQEAATAWGNDPTRRFHHISTDEVFGALGPDGAFVEESPYQPNSPYSASKAASDHFVRAWGETYGLSYVITNCTNNYGPYQFPEKLIPVVIDRALRREPVPVYGEGSNIRDWLYVEDHCRALRLVFDEGTVDSTYCIGGEEELSNLELVELILDTLDELQGNDPQSSRSLISFVTDRPGHDFRYAMDISHIKDSLGWKPSIDITSGIRATVSWYLENQIWAERVTGDDHDSFQSEWYKERGDE